MFSDCMTKLSMFLLWCDICFKKKKKERKKDKEKKDMVEKRLAFPNVAQKLILETKGSCLEAASIFFLRK